MSRHRAIAVVVSAFRRTSGPAKAGHYGSKSRDLTMLTLRIIVPVLLAIVMVTAEGSVLFAQNAALRWAKAAPFPEPEEELYGVSMNGKMYVIGGFGTNGKPATAMVYEYDQAADRWTKKKSMPVPVHHQAQAAFNGKIYVRPDAQKTDAKQTNQVLLLSEDATINTKPQLEIFADDVKCTHGATVGQLDENALFYLRARGIGPDEARAMLIHAFAEDIVERIRIEPLRESLEAILLKELPNEPR